MAVAAIPKQDPHALTQAFRTILFPLVRPYILSTSQWQQWNLFAPDPLRESGTMRITGEKADGTRVTLATLGPETVSFFRRAKELKLLRKILEDDQLLHAFALAQCRLPGESLASITLEVATRRTPSPEEVHAAGGWKNIERHEGTRTAGPFPCSA